MDADLITATGKLYERKSVVEIFGVFRINSESKNLPEVSAFFYFFLFPPCFVKTSQGKRFFFHLRREVAGEAFLEGDAFHFGVVFSGLAQDFQYFSGFLGTCPVNRFGGFYGVKKYFDRVSVQGGIQKDMTYFDRFIFVFLVFGPDITYTLA